MNILIIGGSSDLGISLAKSLKLSNNNVILTYNNHITNIEGIDSLKLDVRDESAIETIFNELFKKYGHIDILINMSATYSDAFFLEKTQKEFMDVLEVNLVGCFLTCREYAKHTDNGMIINIASTDGIDTYSSYNIDYSASKAGLINITKSIALSTSNIVYCLCPNWIDSNSTRSINKEYLNNELLRIKQSRLIKIDEFISSIYKIIKSNEKSGTIFRIDIKDDEVWTEKI